MEKIQSFKAGQKVVCNHSEINKTLPNGIKMDGIYLIDEVIKCECGTVLLALNGVYESGVTARICVCGKDNFPPNAFYSQRFDLVNLIQSEDITCDQKYTIKTRIPDVLKLFSDVNSIEARLLIKEEEIKCMETKMFLTMELSKTDYKARDIDIVNGIRSNNFKNRMDYARNFIFCLRMKEMLSSIIKSDSGLYERYLLFTSDNLKYYDLLKAKGAFNTKTINPEVYRPSPKVFINKSIHRKTTKALIRIEEECFNWSCGEISLKYEIKERPTVQLFTSKDVYNFMLQNVGIDSIQIQEHFFAIYFNHSREVLGYKTISKGDLKSVNVNIQQILCAGIILNANSFVVIHNHPSNTLVASVADIEITNKIFDAAIATGMCLLDHLILSSYGYLSMNDHNIVSFKQQYPYKRKN